MTNIDELKNTGLKATLPRLKILEIFQGGKQRHMTAEDVFRVLLEERSDIGLATVYRVLMQFEQAGLLNRSNFESGKAVYEINEGQHHDHLVCLDCGKVEEFYDAEIEKRQHAVAETQGLCHRRPLAVDLCPLHQDRLPQPAGSARAAPPGLNFHRICVKSPLCALCTGTSSYLFNSNQATVLQSSCSIARRWRSTNSW